MATQISGITQVQHRLLMEAFGYESYPNGNSGHTRAAVQWLNKQGFVPSRKIAGDAFATAARRYTKVYFTYSQVKDLKARAKARGY